VVRDPERIGRGDETRKVSRPVDRRPTDLVALVRRPEEVLAVGGDRYDVRDPGEQLLVDVAAVDAGAADLLVEALGPEDVLSVDGQSGYLSGAGRDEGRVGVGAVELDAADRRRHRSRGPVDVLVVHSDRGRA
jgi:hypothetical protein